MVTIEVSFSINVGRQAEIVKMSRVPCVDERICLPGGERSYVVTDVTHVMNPGTQRLGPHLDAYVRVK